MLMGAALGVSSLPVVSATVAPVILASVAPVPARKL